MTYEFYREIPDYAEAFLGSNHGLPADGYEWVPVSEKELHRMYTESEQEAQMIAEFEPEYTYEPSTYNKFISDLLAGGMLRKKGA